MVGKYIIIVANLAPRKIRGRTARMFLAASEMPMMRPPQRPASAAR